MQAVGAGPGFLFPRARHPRPAAREEQAVAKKKWRVYPRGGGDQFVVEAEAMRHAGSGLIMLENGKEPVAIVSAAEVVAVVDDSAAAGGERPMTPATPPRSGP